MFMEWMLYSQFTDVKEVARGGFGIMYQATWLDGSIGGNSRKLDTKWYKWSKNEKIVDGRIRNETVILKNFENSQEISKHFLNEVNTFICIFI